MRIRTPLRAAVALSGAVIGSVLCLSGPALAAPATTHVPPDVSAVLTDDAPQFLQSQDVGAGSSLQARDAHQVFRFTDGFLEGLRVEAAVPTGDWLASVTRGDVVLGTLRVAKPDGSAAQLTGFDADVDFGAALGDLQTGEVLVEDSNTGGYFAVDGTNVRPLNDWAQLSIAGPADLSQLQEVLASDRAAEQQRADDTATRQYWLRIAGVGGVAALLLAFGSVFIRLRLQAGRTRAFRNEGRLPG
jgi:hypothetical protein